MGDIITIIILLGLAGFCAVWLISEPPPKEPEPEEWSYRPSKTRAEFEAQAEDLEELEQLRQIRANLRQQGKPDPDAF